jgi:RNA polymerase sigma-70 factor (ECF subfamily)
VPDPPEEVVARARAGDDAAFASLYAHYQAPIWNYLYRILGDRADADEFAQDTFLKAYRGLPHIAGDLRFGAWLYRIATNVALDALRHRALVRWEPFDRVFSPFTSTLSPRWRRWGAGDGIDEGPSVRRQGHELLSRDRREDPEQAALDAEVVAQVRRVLAQLPPRHRASLELREYLGLTYDEMADVMGTTRSSVKSLLFRARRDFGRHWHYDERHGPRSPAASAGAGR